jgi:succinate dehydrogenase/fumarate reductase cytochrome b subunit
MNDNLHFAIEGAWKVLLAGLILGAGLPAVFAFGVRSLAWGTGGSAEVAVDAQPHPVGRALAAVCFLVVLAGIALGLTIIIAAGQGKIVSFDHVYPTIVDKPK